MKCEYVFIREPQAYSMFSDVPTGSVTKAGDFAAKPTAVPTETLVADPTVNPTAVSTQVPTLTPTVVTTVSPTTLFNLLAIFIKDLLIETPVNKDETKWSVELKF